MKFKMAVVPLIVCAVSALATPAHALVQAGNVSIPTTVADPLSGFSITYSFFGSHPLASATVSFFLSTTPNGSSARTLLAQHQVLFSQGGIGIFFPPTGPQTEFVSSLSMTAAARTFFQNLKAACQQAPLFVLVQVDNGNLAGSNVSTMGTIGLPDFAFTAGTLSPATIHPGDTTTLTFSVTTTCPAPQASRVGIFLADASFNLLQFIGAVSVAAGAGTSTLPPTGIAFSTATPPGSYNLVLLADVDGVIAESNENNNAGAFAFTVVPSALAANAKSQSELEPDVETSASDLELRELERSLAAGHASFATQR